jgi:hypothetical protein
LFVVVKEGDGDNALLARENCIVKWWDNLTKEIASLMSSFGGLVKGKGILRSWNKDTKTEAVTFLVLAQ